MSTTHEQTDEHACKKAGCIAADKRPKDWSPTIGPVRRSKGVKRQEKRVAAQQRASALNASYYQNGREWHGGQGAK
jgi:hypothetical protein